MFLRAIWLCIGKQVCKGLKTRKINAIKTHWRLAFVIEYEYNSR